MSYLLAYRLNAKLAFRVWQRELTLYKRIWPSTILSTLFDPILYLLAMGFGVGAYITQTIEGVSYLQFIAPGLVASSVMYAAAYEAAWNSYVRIYHERSYDAMMTTPAELEDVVGGEVAWGATRACIYSIVMLGVLAAFGLVRSPWALLVPVVAFLGGAMFMVLGLAYTVRVKHMDQLTFLFTLGVTPMFLFSGVFFPLAGLPAWVQVVAWVSPLYHLVEIVRALALGAIDVALAGHAAWMLVAVVALWGLPVSVLRRKLRS
ncbi:MAG TPA: ABC transporter permease [Candidatus Thermoplasmatota archaeon]|nr:ABC transporter permease [Candidatus Thermoplasmatota archaeon]